jgi:SET domain
MTGSKRSTIKPMFGLSPVAFRNSDIAGRGVFARRRFMPGDVVVAYAPKQRRVPAASPEATAAADTKLTLLSGDQVIIPDESVPGGWLCNHSCSPNATLYASGEGRIQCRREIAPGEEVTIFYGWVSEDDPERDPCRCGSPNCRRFINFDVRRDDLDHVVLGDAAGFASDEVVRGRFDDYELFLRSIGQEQVMQAIRYTLARMQRRTRGGGAGL